MPRQPAPASAARSAGWPALPLAAWADTYATLHRWLQVVGKTRLALAPPQNHWWHVPLYVSARGLTTSRMPHAGGAVEVEVDFVTHALTMRASDGRTYAMPLAPRSVADFHAEYREGLREVGVAVAIWPRPVEVEDATPFDEDTAHAAYDADAAHRCWQALAASARVLEAFRGGWVGKCSPVHFFWGSFDLAHTRFSGRPAPPHPGGIPNLADRVTREAYSHECWSAGWWPGLPGAPVEEPVFYAYAYPEPAGFAEGVDVPGARYDAALREWVLPHDAVRLAADPDGLLLAFLQAAYARAADRGGWDRRMLERAGRPEAVPPA